MREHRLIIVRVRVDKPRRNDPARGINRLVGAMRAQVANGRDVPIAQCYVCNVARRVGAVDDGAAADDEVEVR